MSKSALQRGRSNFLHLQRGFTLLEVLVVLVIISVIIGLAVLNIDTGPERVRREGGRLAALLELAAEEAVMNGRECRVVLRRHGYSFELLTAGKWQAAEDELLRPRQLPEGLTLRLSLENREVPLADAEEVQETAAPNGALFLLSSGEITPFELTVSSPSSGEVVIRGDGTTISSEPAA